MGWFALIVLILSSKINWTNTICPAPEIVSPCVCRHEPDDGFGSGESIVCHGSSIKNLKMTFDQISENRKNGVRHFHKLLIQETLIDHFESRLIGELTFDFINIFNNPKLKKVHRLAFNHTASRIKYFALSASPEFSLSPAPYNLFDMLNLFVNVKGILTHWNKITSLPDKAFYNLKNLTYLVLNGQRINYISSNAFHQSESKQTLEIHLAFNNLNSSSFSSGWLNYITRRADISLDNNQITVLDQKMFQSFLDDKRNNRINNLSINPLNCSDCRNAWLEKSPNRNKYKTQVLLAHCGGKKENPTIFQSDFDHCEGKV